MPSKGVMDRHRVAKVLVAAARTHAREVGERLNEVLAPALPEGESPFELVRFQETLARHLEMRIEAIVAADEVYIEELDDDDDPRRRRDETAAALYSTLVAVRVAVVGGFGREHLKALLGYEGSTPSDPLELQRVASRVLKRLRTPPEELPPARLRGVHVDLSALAEELQPALDDLSAALEAVDLEGREAEATRRAKDLELDAFDAAVAGMGRVLTGFDALAGFPQYADKIRLSLPGRRRRGTGNGDELPPGDESPSDGRELSEIDAAPTPKAPVSVPPLPADEP